jgi:hypothetical protein
MCASTISELAFWRAPGALLQVVLDKGQEDNWFYSPPIATLEAIFPVALMLFVIRELTRQSQWWICGCSRTATSRRRR